MRQLSIFMRHSHSTSFTQDLEHVLLLMSVHIWWNQSLQPSKTNHNEDRLGHVADELLSLLPRLNENSHHCQLSYFAKVLWFFFPWYKSLQSAAQLGILFYGLSLAAPCYFKLFSFLLSFSNAAFCFFCSLSIILFSFTSSSLNLAASSIQFFQQLQVSDADGPTIRSFLPFLTPFLRLR